MLATNILAYFYCRFNNLVSKKNKEKMISQREKRFLFITFLVTGCIVLCWGPFFIVSKQLLIVNVFKLLVANKCQF